MVPANLQKVRETIADNFEEDVIDFILSPDSMITFIDGTWTDEDGFKALEVE